MNVMGTKQKLGPTLVSILSSLAPDTSVTIEIDDCPTAFVARITTRKDVLRLCQKCSTAYGSHPRVYEIAIADDYMGARLHLRCC